MTLTVPHGGDPVAAALSLGLTPDFRNFHDEGHYEVNIPQDREADFLAAYAADPAPVYLAIARARAKVAIRALATAAVFAVWPDWKQANAALGVYGPDRKAECAAFIQAIRDRTDELDALIDASDDPDALDLVI